MSEIKVSSITDRAGTGKPNFSNQPTVDGGVDPNSPPSRVEGSSRPSSPREGDTWWDTTNSNYEVFIDDSWEVILGSGYTSKFWFGNRAVIHGDAVWEFYDITTLGNASSWGDSLQASRQNSCAASNHTYGIIAGGTPSLARTSSEKYAIATSGSASIGWSSLTENSIYSSATSNMSVMHIGMGQRSSHPDNNTDFISFETSGSATQGGNLTQARTKGCSLSDGTYGYYLAGQTSSSSGYTGYMEYLNIGTTSSAVYMSGSRTVTQGGLTTAAGNTWRGLMFGGFNTPRNTIDYITLGISGSATDFGDLLTTLYQAAASANETRACVAGGYSSSLSNVIQYVTIDTKGNAADFGDLTGVTRQNSGISGGAA